MSKYDVLGGYLKQHPGSHLPMSFSEVEHVLGFKLPASAHGYPAWWANEHTSHVQARAWMNAGFETEQVDLVAKKLVFKRVRDVPPSAAKSHRTVGEVTGMSEEPHAFKPAEGENEKKPMRSPLFGSMKGTFTIEPAYDLTQPAMPPEEWAEIEAEILAKFDRAFGDSGKKT